VDAAVLKQLMARAYRRAKAKHAKP